MAKAANTVFENYFLSNEVEDQLLTHLDVQQYFKVDKTLEGTAGMTRKINVYRATDGTEKLDVGEGNSKSITVSYSPKEYKIGLAQNRFVYNDEQAMTDPMLVPVGMKHAGTDMFNTITREFFAELENCDYTLAPTGNYFDDIVDAMAQIGGERPEDVKINVFVNPADVAKMRKSLKDSLQYVEAYARGAYIGTVAGANVYPTKAVDAGKYYVATSDAVTLFEKTGVEIEQITAGTRSETAANVRENTIFTRKYYIVAMTDATKAVKVAAADDPV